MSWRARLGLQGPRDRPTKECPPNGGRPERHPAWKATLLQQDGDGGGGDVEAVDAAAEFEGPADDGVGVHGDEEILNQEVEGAAVDDNTGDLHALYIDGGAAGGGA